MLPDAHDTIPVPPTPTLPSPPDIALEGLRAKLERVALALSEFPMGTCPSVELGIGREVADRLLALGGTESRWERGVVDVQLVIRGVTFGAQYADVAPGALAADAAALGDAS